MSVNNANNSAHMSGSSSPLRSSQRRNQEVTGKITGTIARTDIPSSVCYNSPTGRNSLSPQRLIQQNRGELTEKITSQVVGIFGNQGHYADPQQGIIPVKSPSTTRTEREDNPSSTPARLQQWQNAELEATRKNILKCESSINSEIVEDTRSKQVRFKQVSSELDLAIQELERLVPESKELADTYVLSSKLAEKKNDFSDALKKYGQAIVLYGKNQIEPVKYASILMKMGMLCESLDKVDEALIHSKKVAEIYTSHSNTTKLTLEQANNFAENYGRIASLILDKGQMPRDTLVYHLMRSKIYEEYAPNSLELAQCYDQIAMLETEKKFHYVEKSLDIQEALPIADRDLIFARVQKIYESYEKTAEIVSNLARVNQSPVYDLFSGGASLPNRARANRISMQLRGSIKQYEDILEAKQKVLPTSTFVAASFENIGDTYRGLKKGKHALDAYSKALAIYSKKLCSKDRSMVSLREKLEEVMAELKGEPSIARAVVSMSMARDHSVIRAQSISSADTIDALLKNLKEDSEDPTMSALSAKIKELFEKNSVQLNDVSLSKLIDSLNQYSSGTFLKSSEKDAARDKLRMLLIEYRSNKSQAKYNEIAKYVNDELYVKGKTNPLFQGNFSSNLAMLFSMAAGLFKLPS